MVLASLVARPQRAGTPWTDALGALIHRLAEPCLAYPQNLEDRVSEGRGPQ